MESNDSNGHNSTTTASLDTYINIGMSWHVSNLSNYPNPQGFASFAIFNFGYMWAIPHLRYHILRYIRGGS